MKIVGIGVDIVETARIESSITRLGEAFLKRVFTAAEREYCARMKVPVPSYAVRFAAKEAVSKAFGTGIGESASFQEIEVRRKATGEPFIVLHGSAAETARQLGITQVLISLSHSENYAVANAIAMGG